jgi:ClpP class serine protease
MKMSGSMDEERAEELSQILSSGRWTHDYPITVEEALELGLPVKTDMPEEVYALMALYPQAPQRRPTVEYIPTPYVPKPSGESEQAK